MLEFTRVLFYNIAAIVLWKRLVRSAQTRMRPCARASRPCPDRWQRIGWLTGITLRKGETEGEAMLNIVLVEPEIPPNCGNIARTCAATGSRLHLVEPLGFDVSDKAVKRAGLDYWHLVEVAVYSSLDDLFRRRPEAAGELWLATTKAPMDYSQARFSPDSWLFFGKETKGLPLDFRERFRERCIRLPMVSQARSLNLANSAAVLIYEALRQNGFPGLLGTGEMRSGGV